MSECLSIKQLDGLAAGTLADGEAAQYRVHVEACDDCRRQLEECRENLAYLAKAKPTLRKLDSTAEATMHLVGPEEASDRVPSIPGYEVLREFHRGGQGVVYEVIQESTKR